MALFVHIDRLHVEKKRDGDHVFVESSHPLLVPDEDILHYYSGKDAKVEAAQCEPLNNPTA